MNRFIFSGFGGQGLLTLGEIVATICMKKGKHVTWMPSYGPEMRGGTANCAVIVSDKLIGSPIVLSHVDTLFAMNQASVDKFVPRMNPNGLVLMNSSLVVNKPTREDIRLVEIDATNIAVGVGNIRVANMAMLAGLIKNSELVNLEDVKSILEEKFIGARSAQLIPLNLQAIEQGIKSLK